MASLLRARVRRLSLPIRTRRLALTLPSARHVPALVALLSDPRVARWTLRIPERYTEADARAHVRRAQRNFCAGRALSLQIVRRRGGTVVGGIGLADLDAEHARAEVGYWLGRRYRGLGFAGEALGAITTLGFRTLGLHRIEAGVLPGNRASVRVLDRAGFRFEGTLREYVRKDGRWRSTWLFARLATDARPARVRPPYRSARGRGGSSAPAGSGPARRTR